VKSMRRRSGIFRLIRRVSGRGGGRSRADGLVAIEKLRKTGKFDVMDLETDSDEHSLEMHLPYIRLLFRNS
jgi:hypothetical protein